MSNTLLRDESIFSHLAEDPYFIIQSCQCPSRFAEEEQIRSSEAQRWFSFSSSWGPMSTASLKGSLPSHSFSENSAWTAFPGAISECWKRFLNLALAPRSLSSGNFQTRTRSEEHTSELQSPCNLVCRLLLEKKKPTLRLYASSRRCSEHRMWAIRSRSYPHSLRSRRWTTGSR